jgi:hypothetical protein
MCMSCSVYARRRIVYKNLGRKYVKEGKLYADGVYRNNLGGFGFVCLAQDSHMLTQ